MILKQTKPFVYILGAVVAVLLVITLARPRFLPGTSTPPASGAQPSHNLAGRLAFTSDETGNANTYLLDLASGQVTRVTEDAANNCCLTWAPDGKRLAFGGKNQIFLVNPNGTGQAQLTRRPGRWEAFGPTWSPDGTQLAVASHGEIFIIPADESAADITTWTQLTQVRNDDVDAITPAWSPAGDRIAFSVVRENDNTAKIYTVQSDGSDLQQLTTDATAHATLSWSPDGTHIVYVSARAGNEDIYLMRADGTSSTQLTTNAARETLPTWSPNGQFVAFATNRAGN